MEAIFLVIEVCHNSWNNTVRFIHAFSTYEKAQAYIGRKAPGYDPVYDDGIFKLKLGEHSYIDFTLEVLEIDEGLA